MLDGVVLSMHMRVGHSEMDMIDKNGNIEGWYKPNVQTFINCMHELILTNATTINTIFIATDNLNAQRKVEAAAEELGIAVVFTAKPWTEDGRLISTDPSKSLNEGQYTVEAFESALVDYWLLGEAQHIIVSTMSSVASFAPARKSIVPIVASVDKQCITLPPMQTQPCLHLLARDFRSALHAQGDYDYNTLCADQSEGRVLRVRRNSAFFHSENLPYTCIV